jgi:gluconokinase
MLYDEQAHFVKGCDAQIKYRVHTTPDGGNELDADNMFRCANRAIDQLLEKAGRRTKHIVAVASDSLVSNVLGVDEHGRAVTPVFTYADTRNAREVGELRAQLDERITHQRVGTLFHSSYLPARFLWYSRTHADEFKRVRYWMSLGEYFLMKWTGERACSYSVASWTGLLNRQTLTWDNALITQLPITNDQLSPLIDHDYSVGTLRGEYANRWRALRDAKWFPTVGDGAVANLGSGCVDASRVAITIGTSSAMRIARARAQENNNFSADIPWGLWSYSISRDTELLGGALSEGGNLFSWMKQTLRLKNQTGFENALETIAPDSHGLTILPFLAGERAPNWNADARASIIGMSLNTQPIHILRAGIESIAYRLGLIFQLLKDKSPSANQVIASGGALMNSPVWIQIIADTLNVPVAASAETEATSRGTALLALKSLGIISSLGDLPARTGTVYTPDAARHEIYAHAIERQKSLYNAVVKR